MQLTYPLLCCRTDPIGVRVVAQNRGVVSNGSCDTSTLSGIAQIAHFAQMGGRLDVCTWMYAFLFMLKLDSTSTNRSHTSNPWHDTRARPPTHARSHAPPANLGTEVCDVCEQRKLSKSKRLASHTSIFGDVCERQQRAEAGCIGKFQPHLGPELCMRDA
jgi:hypothetical protein